MTSHRPILRLCAALLMVSMVAGPAVAQTTRPVAGAVGKALSDLADKYIDQDLALERMRAQAELDAQARRAATPVTRIAPAADAADPVGQQMAVLDREFPGWDRVMTSTAFQTWLGTRPRSYQGMCKSTRLAGVMFECLRDFLNARIVAAN